MNVVEPIADAVTGGLAARAVEPRTGLDESGHTTRVTSTSLVHLVQQHLAVLETTVVAEDWSGPLVVRSGIDGRVANRNVAADRLLAERLMLPDDAAASVRAAEAGTLARLGR